MERLYKPHRLNEILNKYNFKFTKSLGQNFLIDGNIVRKIADTANINEDSIVLEIGPGIGTLTEELALRAKKVLAIEIDESLREVHEETLPFENVEVIFSDVLKLDLNQEIRSRFGKEKISIVANLPYYVTTPIITKIIESNLAIENMVFMVQKEVAKRFCAEPGSKDYGSLSVMLQYYSDIKYCFNVPKTVFMPRPNVDSAVVKFEMKDELVPVDTEKLFKIARASFSKRRKTILNALSSYGFDITKSDVQKALEMSGIDEKRRAETLTQEEFIVLSINFPEIGGRDGK